MREDFVTRLEYQLSEAERRRERGSAIGRLLARARAWLPSPRAGVGLATAAAVVVALAVGAVALTRGGDENTVGRSPSVVARTSLGAESGACPACDAAGGPFRDVAAGFGAVWIGGLERGEVVRVDAATRRVVARIPVGRLPSGIVTAAGAVWVVVKPSDASSTLLRIDPADSRVAARISLPAVSVVPRLLGNSRALWVLGEDGGVRIDPRRGAVAGSVRWNLEGGVFAEQFGLAGDDLWVRGDDGQLLRLDARTGARVGRSASPPGRASLAVIPGAGVVVGSEDGTLTRIDASTGRVLWTARLADARAGYSRKTRTIAVADGAVWALSQNNLRGTERLTAVDLASGKRLSSTVLEDNGADWLMPVAGELWFITPSSQAVVVRQ